MRDLFSRVCVAVLCVVKVCRVVRAGLCEGHVKPGPLAAVVSVSIGELHSDGEGLVHLGFRVEGRGFGSRQRNSHLSALHP